MDFEEIAHLLPMQILDIKEVIGSEKTLLLIKKFGGEYVYIPKIDSVDRYYRNKNIREDFNGYNYKELASKYNLSEIQLRNIVLDIIERKKAEPAKEQLCLFDINEISDLSP